MTRDELAKRIDHTQLSVYATQVDIEELCSEAIDCGLGTVTVNPAWVSFCARLLEDTDVGVDTTVGFPLGSTTAHVKVEETREAIRNGATEIDMMINVGALKSGYPNFVEKEIEAIVRAAGDAPVKVILEMCYLSEDEKKLGCELAVRAGAAYVKTSTGFGSGGALVEDVTLMREIVGDRMGIKAAGGIRDYETAISMIRAGATRIGTSAALAILADAPT